MKKIKQKLLGVIFSMVLAISSLGASGMTAFAAESNDNGDVATVACYNVEITSEGIESVTDAEGRAVDSSKVVLRSSISGYDQDTINDDPFGIIVYTDSWGIGGMGITITTSSSWNGYFTVDAWDDHSNDYLVDQYLHSNDSTEWHNLIHYSPSWIWFSFEDVPAGQTVFAQIWVYG